MPYSTTYSYPYSYPLKYTKKSRSQRQIWRIIIDILILLGVALLANVGLDYALPSTMYRGFFCNDETLQFPYTSSEYLQKPLYLGILVLVLPIAVIIIGELLRAAVNNKKVVVQGYRIPRFLVDCYRLIGIYLFVLALEEITVRLTAQMIGRLRPHFRDVCQPHLPNGNAACANDTMESMFHIIDYNCTSKTASMEALAEVRLSMPSRVVALTWHSMCFVVFYLQARLATPAWRTLRLVLQFAALTLASLVAMECIHKNIHHWTDCFAGAIMGVIFAAFAAFSVANLFEHKVVEKRMGSGSHFAYSDVYSVYGVLPRRRKYDK